MASFETNEAMFIRNGRGLRPTLMTILPVNFMTHGEELLITIEGLGTLRLTPEETKRLYRSSLRAGNHEVPRLHERMDATVIPPPPTQGQAPPVDIAS